MAQRLLFSLFLYLVCSNGKHWSLKIDKILQMNIWVHWDCNTTVCRHSLVLFYHKILFPLFCGTQRLQSDIRTIRVWPVSFRNRMESYTNIKSSQGIVPPSIDLLWIFKMTVLQPKKDSICKTASIVAIEWRSNCNCKFEDNAIDNVVRHYKYLSQITRCGSRCMTFVHSATTLRFCEQHCRALSRFCAEDVNWIIAWHSRTRACTAMELCLFFSFPVRSLLAFM